MFGRIAATTVVLVLASAGVAMAGTIVVDSRQADTIELRGVGCGASASATIALAPTAFDIDARRPKVGSAGYGSRITEVAVVGTSVRVTAVGQGEDVCDPAADPDVPPSQRTWSDFYPYDFRYKERATVAYWPGAQLPRKPKVEPRKVTLPHVANGIKLRWHAFGGRKAVAFGKLKAIPPPGVKCNYRTCPGHNGKIKVVLTKPSRCPELGNAVFYGKVAFYMREKARFMKKGDLYTYSHPICAFGKPKPV
ncbi:MAG TPA: hypothetical protein VFX51_10965 [Solirubrobacteraceae bacterium]|nr:hypothetical protein [Solirubrobacteraceae bacterium]